MHAIEDRLPKTFGAWAKGGLLGSRFAPARVLRPEKARRNRLRFTVTEIMLCEVCPWDSFPPKSVTREGPTISDVYYLKSTRCGGGEAPATAPGYKTCLRADHTHTARPAPVVRLGLWAG